LPVSGEELQNLKRFGIPQLLEDFRNGTHSMLRAAMATRKLFAAENDLGLADKLIALGLTNDLCAALDRSDSPRLQFESLWAITNCAIVRADAVVRAGVLPKVVHLLEAGSMSLREQAMWSLGNIASKSPAYRNQLLELGALQRIRVSLLQVYAMKGDEYETYARASEGEDSMKSAFVGLTPIPLSKQNFLRQATWAMSNAVRGGDVDDFALREVSLSLPALRDLILNVEESHLLANAMWILADFAERRPRAVLELGVLDRILELGLHPHEAVQGAASQCISNMCAGDGQSLRALMLPRRADLVLVSHLHSERPGLWANASWTLSYACAELPILCHRLLDAVEVVLEKLGDRTVASEIRQDCASIVSASFSTDSGSQLLVTSEVPMSRLLEALSEGLERDIVLAAKVVQCITNLLHRGGREFIQAFEERGGLESIRRIERSQLQASRDGTNALQSALENANSVFDDWESEEAFVEAQSLSQSMVRDQPKNCVDSRHSFQAFMKE
jgi:hypothetical protein